MKSKKVILGQFYTSKEVADFMVSLSKKSKQSKVLESGFGEGIFIKSLIDNGFLDIKGYDIDNKNYEFVKNLIGEKVNLECLDYLKSPRDEKFDLIIGNPPYVHWNNIDKEIRDKLSSDSFWKKYSNGEWDLLYAFIIWSVEKLNEGGELIYIVPYNWFNSTYGASLRKYLIDNGHFDIICHFGEFKLFGDCYPNNIIFKYTKQKRDNSQSIIISEFKGRKGNISQLLKNIKQELESVKEVPYEKECNELKIFTMDHFDNESFWHLATPKEKEHISQVEEATKGVTLSGYLDVGVGIVSGYDEAYVIKDNQLDLFSDPEKKFIFPFVKAKNCKRYFITNSSYYLFADDLQTEEDLKDYPYVYEWLLKYKEGLDKRYMTKNKKWWNWATIRNKELFERSLDKPKIFVPCIDRSLKARYSYTKDNLFGSGDVLIIVKREEIKEDLKYILAWLNSKVINEWYRIKGSHTGHRIRYTQSYVSKVPLRLIDWNNEEEVKIYNQILEKTNQILNEGENLRLEEEIDRLFNSLIF